MTEKSLNELYEEGLTEYYLSPENIYKELDPSGSMYFKGAKETIETIQLWGLEASYPDPIIDLKSYRSWSEAISALEEQVGKNLNLAIDDETNRLFMYEKIRGDVNVKAMFEIWSEKEVEINLPQLLKELKAHELFYDSYEASKSIQEQMEEELDYYYGEDEFER